MANWLTKGAEPAAIAAIHKGVQQAVESMLADIEARGDATIWNMSINFDKSDRDDYRLSQAEIDACLKQLSRQDIHNIEYAQKQVRSFNVRQ